VRILPALLVAAAIAFAAPAAHANMTAVFTGNSGSTYNYTLRFTTVQVGELLRSGDFITIYDIGPAAAITSATAPAGFSVGFANTGVTPTGLTTADDASLLNVTFTFLGPTRTTAFDYTGVHIETNPDYTGTQFGKAAGTTSFLATHDQLSTNITVIPAPAGGNTPEPASLALFSLGAVALLARRRA
jgi:hypothetical protein